MSKCIKIKIALAYEVSLEVILQEELKILWNQDA